MSVNSKMAAIADAIRGKTGKSGALTLDQMATEIAGIQTGGNTEELTKFSQMTPIVSRYMSEVTYSPDDYSASAILPYVYEETDYEKGYPAGYNVDITQSGELHLADDLSVIKMQSYVGTNTLFNAIPGEVAHWWNTVGGNVTQNGTIKPTGQVRMIKTTANNVRDLGGWPCDGGTIRYGKLFRGGLLSESDAEVLVKQCSIRHDLDLRGKIENEGLIASPLGSEITYTCPDEYVWYSLEKEDSWRTILSTIFGAVSRNEPVIFHCAAGADRTGTVACIVEAILGVSQPNLDKDFELTSFAIAPNARRRTDDNWKNLITEITSISVGASFRDKIINWVGYLGFTAAEINAFRKSMIDGTPGNIVIEEYVPEEPEAPAYNYFDASAAELNKRIGSSGTLSAYNGIVVSDYIPVNSSMSGKKFKVSGITTVVNTSYGYQARIAFYDINNAYISGSALNHTTSFNYETDAWDTDIDADNAYIRISLVIKDNIAITNEDIANIKITLE